LSAVEMAELFEHRTSSGTNKWLFHIETHFSMSSEFWGNWFPNIREGREQKTTSLWWWYSGRSRVKHYVNVCAGCLWGLTSLWSEGGAFYTMKINRLFIRRHISRLKFVYRHRRH